MSKTLADLAKLLSASNEQLFDRYINVRFMQKPTSAAARVVSGFDDTVLEKTVDDFYIRTPKAGIKPHIAVTGTMLVSSVVSEITLTIYNMSENIDTMAYNFVEIEAGYMNSGVHITFQGQIINCYMAKPNPNGELVVTIACAPMVDLYARGDFEITYSKDTLSFTELINETVDVIQKVTDNKVGWEKNDVATTAPAEWKTQTFDVGKATRKFRSAFECIAWLNSLFASYTYNTNYALGPGASPIVDDKGDASAISGLPPVKLGFDEQGYLRLKASMSDVSPATMKALTCIGSAFLTGGASAGTVTAPFNPGILPGDVIFIDLKYFKTRVRVGEIKQDYDTMGNIWYVLQNSFVFDTIGANTMTLLLNNTGNKIDAGEG